MVYLAQIELDDIEPYIFSTLEKAREWFFRQFKLHIIKNYKFQDEEHFQWTLEDAKEELEKYNSILDFGYISSISLDSTGDVF